MNKQNYALEVQINGRPAKEYYKNNKCFVEGRENTQYTLKLHNNSWKRILAVFSVDGIEVIEGKVSSEFKGGYVVEAYSSIQIRGYRIDEHSVAAFRFAKTHKSYSNTVGAASVIDEGRPTESVEYKKTTRNNGVIGVRVFEEKIKDNDYDKQYRKDSHGGFTGMGGVPCTFSHGNSPIYISGCGYSSMQAFSGYSSAPSVTFATGCSMALSNINSTVLGTFENESNNVSASSVTRTSYTTRGISSGPYANVNQMGQSSYVAQTITSAPDFNLGTTWGEKVEDKVKETTFEKSDEYVDLEIYYDSRESLAGYGIDFEATKQYVSWPSAFEAKKKFCKVPEGYKS